MAQIKVWNGSAYANPVAIKEWDGASWVAKVGKYWDGASWVSFITYFNNAWSTKLDSPVTRGDAGAATVGDNIYVVGGFSNVIGTTFHNRNDCYSISGNTWSVKTVPPVATPYRGTQDGSNCYFSPYDGGIYKYDPVLNSWTQLTTTVLSGGEEIVLYNNKIYGQASYNTAMKIYDIGLNSWSTGASYAYPAGDFSPVNYFIAFSTVVLLNGNVYVMCGEDGDPDSRAAWSYNYQYNIASNIWTKKANVGPDSDGGGGALNNKIYLIRGAYPGGVDEYNPDTNITTAGINATSYGTYNSAYVTASDGIHLIGGSDTNIYAWHKLYN